MRKKNREVLHGKLRNSGMVCYHFLEHFSHLPFFSGGFFCDCDKCGEVRKSDKITLNAYISRPLRKVPFSDSFEYLKHLRITETSHYVFVRIGRLPMFGEGRLPPGTVTFVCAPGAPCPDIHTQAFFEHEIRVNICFLDLDLSCHAPAFHFLNASSKFRNGAFQL